MKKLLFTLCVLSYIGVAMVSAQTRKISGTVTGAADGLTLPGVSIVIKGTTVGTTTNVDGKYELNAPADASILVFSFVGMTTLEVPIAERAIIDIAMELEAAALEEVVVVGYGTQIKSKVTGNISKVEGESLRNTPVPTVELALQGKTAGVFVESINGKATGASRMRIRGSSSITASNQPLFVIDGIPVTTEVMNQSGASINPLTSINFNDVESVEILKDASSAAIYGSRGANGVVLITTKKGKSGETKLNVNLQYGSSQASHRRDFMNAEQYVAYFRQAAIGGDKQEDLYYGDPVGTSTYWQGKAEGRFKRYSGWAAKLNGTDYVGSKVDTDWQDQAFQKGGMITADVSAQGGTDKLKYFASGSYNKAQGILVSNGIERVFGRLNVDNKINKYINLGLTLSLSRTKIDQVSADNAFSTPMQLVALAPITPVRDLEGKLSDFPVTTYYNGLIDVEEAQRDIMEYRTLANGYLNLTLKEGLIWRNEFGFDLYNLKENSRYGQRTDSGTGLNGYGFSNYGMNQNINTKSYLDFAKSFGDFSTSAVLGTEFQYTTVDNTWVQGQQFPVDNLKTLASAGLISGGTQTLNEYSFVSYFSRVNFDYQSKYLFTVAGRVDGSSRFGPNAKYGFFPAISAGWVVTKEGFLVDNEVLSFLKLRASYGLTGNASIGNFPYQTLWSVGTYNGLAGLTATQIANPDLGWENTKQIDFGLDFGFFKNRITGEIDYYAKQTNDLLLAVPVPGTSGLSVQMQNIGSMENKGFEFVLNTVNIAGEFKWNTNFNISLNRNKVTSLGGQDMIDQGSSRFMNVVKVGEPIGIFWGAEYAGVDPANGDALWYLNDGTRNTTNNFTDAKFINLGKPNPDLIGAVTNTFEYKGIDFSFTLQGVYGNKIHLTGDPYMAANGAWYDNQTTDQLKSWKKPNDITNIPEARLGWSNGDQGRSSRYLSDGSYIKLRSLTLGWELPKKYTSKLKIDRMRVYLQGQNLMTFTKYIGWDPEVSSDFVVDNITSGVDFYSAPQPKTITFGINIGL